MIALETRELETVITKGDKTYTQLMKNDNAYLYEVRDSIIEHTYYELFQRKVSRAYDFETRTRTDEMVVIYPSNEAFGKWALCISRGEDYSGAKELAISLFHEITTKKNKENGN